MKIIFLSLLCAVLFAACAPKPAVPEVADTVGSNTVLVNSYDRTNCVVEDVQITQEEFFAIQAEMYKYNFAECARDVIPEDSAIVLSESNNSSLTFEELMDDVWLGEWPEAGKLNVVISAGDACWTIVHGDTMVVETCGLMLSRDNVLAGIRKDWGAGDDESPAYIYFHRIGDSKLHIYETTPAWTPTGRANCLFWGPDGWFYIEGNIPNTDQLVWHKIKVVS